MMANDSNTADSANVDPAAENAERDREKTVEAAAMMKNAADAAEAAKPEDTPAEAKDSAADPEAKPAETSEPAKAEDAPAETSEPAKDGDKPAEAEKSDDEKKARRRKIVKRVLVGVGIFFGVLLLLLILALLLRDRIAAAVIRSYGTKLTGVKVDVAKIDTSLFKGTVRVVGFTVDNPKGFSQDKKAVELKELFVKVKIGSLFTNRIEVEKIFVAGFRVNAENRDGFEDGNLNAIVKNIQANTKDKKPKKKKKKEEKKAKTDVVIHSFVVKDSGVSLKEAERFVRAHVGDVRVAEIDTSLSKLTARVGAFSLDTAKDDKPFARLSVGDVDCSLAAGTLRVKGVVLTNPKGFSDDSIAVDLKELFVKLDMKSVATKKIVIEEVAVTALFINAESHDILFKDCNLLAFAESITGKKKPKDGEPDKAPDKIPDDNTPEEEKDKTQVVLRHLVIKDSKVSVQFLKPIEWPPFTVNFDFYEKRNIGEEDVQDGSSWSDFFTDLLNYVKDKGPSFLKDGYKVLDKGIKGINIFKKDK